MLDILCEREDCKYCLFDYCENAEIKQEFENISIVEQINIRSCKRFIEDEDIN